MKREILFSIFILCMFTSCKDKSTNTDIANNTKSPTFSFETSKCISSVSSSSSMLAKELISTPDSIFSYSFSQNLILDFSAIGNCCPDSNRFTLGQEIRSDTIIITVIDTSQNLCRCNCLYMIHVEMLNLIQDNYTVRCRLGNGQTFVDPTHLVNVVRKK
jgi:hypothetical protein